MKCPGWLTYVGDLPFLKRKEKWKGVSGERVGGEGLGGEERGDGWRGKYDQTG